MSFWEEIGKYLGSKGHNEKSLRDLLAFIDAMESPIELARVLPNLPKLFSCIDNILWLYPEHLAEIDPDMWKKICSAIAAHPNLAEMVTPFQKKGKMPLRGYYDSNPAYVAVWQRPISPADQRTYFFLLAHVLLSITILKERVDEQKLLDPDDFHSNRSAALLAVRKLASDENLIILESLPDLDVSPEKLLEILNKSDELLTPLKVLFKYLLELRRPPHRQERETSRNPRKKEQTDPRIHLAAELSTLENNLDPGQNQCSTSVDLFHLPSRGEHERKESEKIGCAPSESCSGVEIVSPRSVDPDAKQVRSPSQKAIVSRTIKTQLAMQNQRLISRWEILSLYEISSFLTAVADLLKQGKKSPYLPKHTDPLELAALATSMFWLGHRIDKVIRLNLYGHAESEFEATAGFVWINGLKNGYWWMEPAVPQRTILPDEVQRAQAHEIVAAFPLSSGINVEQIIGTYVEYHQKTLLAHGELFPHSQEMYADMVNAFLTTINHKHSTRLTANRISDYIFEMITCSEGSDLCAAMYITGREHFLGRNPSFYTSLSVQGLQRTYQEVCKEVRDRHLRERPRDSKKGTEPMGKEFLQIASHYVGSPFRPTRSTVKSLVEKLKLDLGKAAEADLSILKLMRLHNNITRYTAYMIAFGTGFRAIKDPFLSAAEVDWRSGFAVLSDKDNEDGYNSRLIWLPPVCLEQLKLFREHQQHALYRFHMLIPNINNKLDHLRRDAPGRHMYFSKFDPDRGEYELLMTSPKRLGTKLRSVYALPFNSSRHYLRSNLLERNCPIEVINALMGHYERGEEPWGGFSGLSPLIYRNVLQEKLVPLLENDGWVALPGLRTKL